MGEGHRSAARRHKGGGMTKINKATIALSRHSCAISTTGVSLSCNTGTSYKESYKNLLINNNIDSIPNNREDIAAVEIQTDFLKQSRVRRTGRFLKGPIPLKDICVAAKLSGKKTTDSLVGK